MSKKMLINATQAEESRVAIVEDGRLVELDIEITGQEQTRGNIYKGTVSRVEPGLQAAFIDFGSERSGFLQMGEIHPSLYPARSGKERPRINDILRRGQELLVQVVKEERGTKGAALTTFLSFPGRYLVLMPQSDTKGISRKIDDDSERKKLKAALAKLNLPKDMGCIIRTAGIGKDTQELQRDFDYLQRLYASIVQLNERTKAPALIYRESNLVIRTIRDYFTPEIDEVLVDNSKVFQEARDFFQQVMPEHAKLVKLHQERRPIFSRYQIEEQIETITQSHVDLPSGGSIVIDSTEALVAIDVNSGKMAGEQGVEATAYKTNLEAVREVARQLRLRDLGGLIVIDLIDMRDRKHIREVEKELKTAMQPDKARVTVGHISQFGLLEMSRQRIKAALATAAYRACPHCSGSGRVMSAEARGLAFLRRVQAGVHKGQIGRVIGRLPEDAARYLLNRKRLELVELEQKFNLEVVIEGQADFLINQSELELVRREAVEQPPARPTEQPATADWALAEMPAETPVTEASATVADETAEEGTETAAPEERKSRRRRRRRKSKTEDTAEEGMAATTAPAAEGAEAAAAEPSEVAAEAAEHPEGEKPKKRRKRGKRGGSKHREHKAAEAGAGTPAETAAAAPAPVTLPAEPTLTTPAPTEAAGEAAADKPKRPRRTRSKAATADAVEAALTETAGEGAEEKSKRPRSKAAADETAKVSPAEGTGEAAENKPKRPRRTRSKAAAAEPAEALPTEAAGDAAAEKPKRPRRTRSKAATTEAEEKAPATDAAAEATEDKPKRPRRTRSKAAATETTETSATKSAPAEDKPKRPRRSRAVKKDTPPDETPT